MKKILIMIGTITSCTIQVNSADIGPYISKTIETRQFTTEELENRFLNSENSQFLLEIVDRANRGDEVADNILRDHINTNQESDSIYRILKTPTISDHPGVRYYKILNSRNLNDLMNFVTNMAFGKLRYTHSNCHTSDYIHTAWTYLNEVYYNYPNMITQNYIRAHYRRTEEDKAYVRDLQENKIPAAYQKYLSLYPDHHIEYEIFKLSYFKSWQYLETEQRIPDFIFTLPQPARSEPDASDKPTIKKLLEFPIAEFTN